MTTVEQRDILTVLAFEYGVQIPIIVYRTGMTAYEVEGIIRRELTDRSKR